MVLLRPAPSHYFKASKFMDPGMSENPPSFVFVNRWSYPAIFQNTTQIFFCGWLLFLLLDQQIISPWTIIGKWYEIDHCHDSGLFKKQRVFLQVVWKIQKELFNVTLPQLSLFSMWYKYSEVNVHMFCWTYVNSYDPDSSRWQACQLSCEGSHTYKQTCLAIGCESLALVQNFCYGWVVLIVDGSMWLHSTYVIFLNNNLHNYKEWVMNW